MLFVSLSDPDIIDQFPEGIDGIEWRLDLTSDRSPGRIATFLEKTSLPVMLTLRNKDQGGQFSESEEERLSLIVKFLELKPHYIDLEYTTNAEFIARIQENYPDTQVILSYHDFHGVPDNLEDVYQTLAKMPAFSYKIAIHPTTTAHALQALAVSRRHPNLSVICMGETGSFARVLGAVAGNVIDYACLYEEAKTAPGQLTIDELTNIYRYHSLNSDTALYGLIGNPVSQSIGHTHHNHIFEKHHLNAVYVKMKVSDGELDDFFPAALDFGFKGLSVTMPLKEKVLPFLNDISHKAKEIGAVNTLSLCGDVISGGNTDATGALDAIESYLPVKSKSLVILGAGGAAKAIAYEALERGARVTLLNRTEEKARTLAENFGCSHGLLSDVPAEYDVMVNCIPEVMPIDPAKINKSAVLMDITYYPKATPFLREGIAAGCKIIYGEEMYIRQAAGQRSIWQLTPQSHKHAPEN